MLYLSFSYINKIQIEHKILRTSRKQYRYENSEPKKVLFAQNLNISKQSCNLCKKRIPKVVPSDIFIHSYAQKQYINAIGKFPPFTKPTSENNLIPASHQRVIS